MSKWEVLEVREGAEDLEALLQECESLTRQNMKAIYDRIQWPNAYSRKRGYSSRSKLRELKQAGTLIRDTESGAFLKIEYTDEASFVIELQVPKKSQGQGVGTALMELALQETRRRGLGAVDLCVQRGNERALEFYKTKLGFNVTETEPDYYLLRRIIAP